MKVSKTGLGVYKFTFRLKDGTKKVVTEPDLRFLERLLEKGNMTIKTSKKQNRWLL